MVLKKVRTKVTGYWTFTKKMVVLMSGWGLIFSLVTIGRLAVAFDYDDTLVFSTPAFTRAFSQSAVPFSSQFWSVVNQSYDLERPKVGPCVLAWLFRICGFRVAVLTARPPTDGEALKKEWRRLVAKGNFVFVGDKGSKHPYLENGNYLVFFGDSDSDITEARKAKVFPIRIRRSPRSSFKDDYHPGSLGELTIPFSEY